jgi:hypothetical protein
MLPVEDPESALFGDAEERETEARAYLWRRRRGYAYHRAC